MAQHKEEVITLLTTHHQLLMENKKQILKDPFLRSCDLPLSFGFGMLGPFDMRLGRLLLLWEKIPTVEGIPLLLLETGGGLSGLNISRWYNLENQRLEEKHNSAPIKQHLFKIRDAFALQNLYVTLPRLLQQLQQPQEYAYSKQLRLAHSRFQKGLLKLQPNIFCSLLLRVSLATTSEDLVQVSVKVPSLMRAVSSPGAINHKGVYYWNLIDALIGQLAASTGFAYVGKDDRDGGICFRQTFDPYAGSAFSAPETLRSIGQLFSGYEAGMEEIHQKI